MSDKSPLSANEKSALEAFQAHAGRNWKSALAANWERSLYPGVEGDVAAALQRLRNTRGPQWLADYSPVKDAERAREAALVEPVIAEFTAIAIELGAEPAQGEAAGRQTFLSMAKAFDKIAKEADRDLRKCRLPVKPRLKPELEVVAWLDAKAAISMAERKSAIAVYVRPYVPLYQSTENDVVLESVGPDSFAAKALVQKTEAMAVLPLAFTTDVPSEQWLAEKVEDSLASGLNRYGVLKYFGPVTGRFNRPLQLGVRDLVGIPGECNEQWSPRPDALEYIRANFEAVAAEPVYVEVDPLGNSWVSEGNHRIMVAAELGILSLPVEVRYFGGSDKKSEWHSPDKLIAMDAAMQLGTHGIEAKPIQGDNAALRLAALGYSSQLEYSESQLKAHLQKAETQKQLDGSFTASPNIAESGQHIGMVVWVTDEFVTQKIDREGNTINHRTNSLSAPVKIRDVVDIKYQGGVGVVAGKESQQQER